MLQSAVVSVPETRLENESRTHKNLTLVVVQNSELCSSIWRFRSSPSKDD
ncbi:hypothetical protein SLEP1_g37519 [Rubroshorea leprosula]|uniref:Uncharacterized protein n=1 Tax=Rubroshorea leprosula TaxID=152421 RepID=A0AAV5KUU1_9ROSI|nr:hypothetical protein SLEP1_g37519 [Rubroshorea leprosula]